MIILQLVDFIEYKASLSYRDDYNHYHDDDKNSSIFNQYQLIQLLKQSLSRTIKQTFSLKFEKVASLEEISINQSSFDIALSKLYDKIIVADGNFLNVYNRSIDKEMVETKLLFKIEHAHKKGFRVMKIVHELGDEYLYASDNSNSLTKAKVFDLINERNHKVIWKSESYFNLWGLTVDNEKVYAVDYEKGIKVLDSKTGEVISEIIPNISNGYGIHFYSERELLVGHSKKLELFQKDSEGIWVSVRTTKTPMNDSYSLLIDDLSGLIYVSDSTANKIHIVKKSDFSFVQSQDGFYCQFGMLIDERNGLLYVCDTMAHQVTVFK